MNGDIAKTIKKRKRAMETIGETKSRTGKGSKEEKKRRSTNQAFKWPHETIQSKQKQAEEERKTREDERKEREEERLEREEERERRDQERNYFFEQIKLQQQQQQQQKQEYAMMQACMVQKLEQQQTQSEMVLNILKKQN